MKNAATDNMDARLAQLREVNCPYRVDVTDRVMDSIVAQQSSHKTVPLRRNWYRYVAVAAACIVAIVAFNITLLYTHSFDEAQLSSMVSDAYSYDPFSADNSSAFSDNYLAQTWFAE